jgi:peptide deformylase
MLREKSKPIEQVNKELQTFIDSMLETMYIEHGAGLAAIQVGVPKRIMLVDVGEDRDHSVKDPHIFINPEILEFSEEQKIYSEGCLSFPGGHLEIERPRFVKVKYTDYHGKENLVEADGWFSRAIQHELDHLDGVLLIDHVSRIKKDVLMRKVKKHIKQTQKDS